MRHGLPRARLRLFQDAATRASFRLRCLRLSHEFLSDPVHIYYAPVASRRQKTAITIHRPAAAGYIWCRGLVTDVVHAPRGSRNKTYAQNARFSRLGAAVKSLIATSARSMSAATSVL